MPTCKADLDCLQDIDDHVLRLDDKVRDIFTAISVRVDTTNYFIIPILVLLIFIVVCTVLIAYFLSRREKLRFVQSSQLENFDSVQALVA